MKLEETIEQKINKVIEKGIIDNNEFQEYETLIKLKEKQKAKK